jgi:hypothetical protein
MRTVSNVNARLAEVWPLLDERTRRLVAANRARALGSGGISRVSRACGLSRKTVAKGVREIETGSAPAPGRIRRPGAGRRNITAHDPRLVQALDRMIEPHSRGDPEGAPAFCRTCPRRFPPNCALAVEAPTLWRRTRNYDARTLRGAETCVQICATNFPRRVIAPRSPPIRSNWQPEFVGNRQSRRYRESTSSKSSPTVCCGVSEPASYGTTRVQLPGLTRRKCQFLIDVLLRPVSKSSCSYSQMAPATGLLMSGSSCRIMAKTHFGLLPRFVRADR